MRTDERRLADERATFARVVWNGRRLTDAQWTDDGAYLVATADSSVFEREVNAEVLEGAVVLVRHPAVRGGGVQDGEREKARAIGPRALGQDYHDQYRRGSV